MAITTDSLRTIVQMPPQRASTAKKNSKKWQEETVEAIIGLSFFGKNFFHSLSHLTQKSYDYYSGRIDMNDYSHVLRPYGKKRKNMPAKLENYNIIKPSIDLLLGEKANRPFNYVVTISNPDVISKREEQQKQILVQNLTENFINELRRLGIDTSEEAGNVEPPESVIKTFERDYTDTRAIAGQESLNYLEDHAEIPRKFRKGFFHFLVSGMVVTEKQVIGDEVRYKVRNPIEIDYDKSPDTEFIEDGEWAADRRLCHLSDVIDEFYEDLTPLEITDLEKLRGQDTYDFLFATDLDQGYSDDRLDKGRHNNRLIEVIKVYWKAMKKIGFLTHIDEESGEVFVEEVDDTYKPTPDDRIDWFWVNEVWEGSRIAEKYYKRIGPFDPQRNSLDNPSICKLPMNGRTYNEVNSAPISLVMLGMPFQQLYNIYHFRLEVAVAKAKEAIMHLDKNMIPSDWDMDTFMYHIDAMGIAWTQRKEGDPSIDPTHKSVIDLSIKNLDQYVKLLEMIEIQWERLSGVSRQRKGTTGPYEGKAVTEQALVQSSHITEDLFMKYAEFEERELKGLLDVSKIAWINGKKGEYVLSDSSRGYLNLEGSQHMETEYGIKITQSGKESDKINVMKALASQIAQQQGTPLSIIASIVDATSFSQLKEQMRSLDDTAQQLREQEQQLAQEQREHEAKIEDSRQQFEAVEKQKDRDTEIQVATIRAEASGGGEDSIYKVDADESGVPDIFEAMDQVEETGMRIDWEREKLTKQQRLDREKLAQKDKIDKSKLKLESKRISKQSKSQ